MNRSQKGSNEALKLVDEQIDNATNVMMQD